MFRISIFSILVILLNLAVIGVLVYLVILLIRALRKYLASSDVRKQKQKTKKSLGEVIRTCRMERNMTQEFVAEALGVSRQAVSKWESGTSEPSTSNLLALAKLFDISPAELLEQVQ